MAVNLMYEGENEKSKRKKYTLNWCLLLLKGKSLWILGFIIFVGINNFCALAISLFMKLFVDISTKQSNLPLERVIIWAALDLLILGISGVVVTIIKNRLYCYMELGIRNQFLKKIYRLSCEKYESKQTGVYLTYSTLDVEKIVKFFTETAVTGVFAEGLTFIISLFLVFYLNWKLAIVLIILFPLFIVLIMKFSPMVEKCNHSIAEDEEKNRILLQESFSKYILFKVYNMYAHLEDKIKAQYANKMHDMDKLAVMQGIMGFMNNFLGVGMFIIALGMGSYLVLRNETTIGSLIAIVNLVSFYYGPFLHISGWISSYGEAKASMKRLSSILEKEEENKVLCGKTKVKGIGVKQLWFHYPNSENILRNVNVQFTKGNIYAIVGNSGSGKSTFMKILLGLYKPSKGEVYYIVPGDMKEIEGYDLFAFDSSDMSICEGTFRENICMAQQFDQVRFDEIISEVNLSQLFQKEGYSYDTYIRESGNNLSAGQRRRVALARTLYSDKEIYLFDEPCVNLDGVTVSIFEESIQKIKKDKIIIIITHDFEIAKKCDVCYKLEKGILKKVIWNE